MINRIFKNIHNRFSKFFKYFFFLRYIISIFLISVFLFLLIPKFFNYEKKHDFIKEYLVNDYGIEVKNFNTIKFYIFPIPNLKIKNVDLKIKGEPIKLNTDNLIIFLSLKSIYNFNNFKANKIILNDSDLEIEIGKLINLDKERSIDVIITRLRKKIELNPKNPKFLQTIRGAGYVLWIE